MDLLTSHILSSNRCMSNKARRNLAKDLPGTSSEVGDHPAGPGSREVQRMESVGQEAEEKLGNSADPEVPAETKFKSAMDDASINDGEEAGLCASSRAQILMYPWALIYVQSVV